MARFMSLGYTGLAADIYWTRAVQYFGDKHQVRSQQYNLLEPLLNLTTSLDPQLSVAYEFGSFFLAQKPPEGAGDPDAAVALVERGIKANPDNWRLYYHLGFIHYSERKDFTAAAEAFERGAQHPNALPWMKVMAAAMRQRGGDLETAQYMWANIYESSTDQNIRENARMHLIALKVRSDIRQLEATISGYANKTGRFPSDWQELIKSGFLPGYPTDPTGAVYRLNEQGRVQPQRPQRFRFLEE
jgi:tetratricopeptide (TPR) repeat protein